MTTVPGSASGGRATSLETGVRRVALLGNPNTGKTTLFNRLTGVRQRTSNFPGTTQEAHIGVRERDGVVFEIVDLPGIYSLELEQSEAEVCRAMLDAEVSPLGLPARSPDVMCIVVDATNLARNLALVGEGLRRRLPTVVALNMTDIAERLGIAIDVEDLSDRLGCAVVACCARSGRGVDGVLAALRDPTIPNRTPPGDQEGLTRWAEEVATLAQRARVDHGLDRLTDRLDRAFMHPMLGLVSFLAVMLGLFWVLFRIAAVPMDLIDGVFSHLAAGVHAVLPAGVIADLLADGVVTGVGATLVFLPQIMLLFFLISLLEDTGYLARAAFLTDRLLRRFGLPGHAFVPLLSSHACALPGIMATRAIPDRRQRLATILVAPFMTCSARLPVYALLVVVLFPGRPAMQAMAFTGSYGVGILAGLLSALIARKTILRGESPAMALELPSYKRPSILNAVMSAWDRSFVFLKKAGSVILAISVVLWWLGNYPQVDASVEAVEMRAVAARVAQADPDSAAALLSEADVLEMRHGAAESFVGRIGRFVQPVFAPLGYDWQLSVGVMASFAAREVFVTTMAVVVTGSDDDGDESILDQVRGAQRSDGETPVFTTATSWSLLVYYILAMQCLPTLVLTARESGGVRWAVLQLVWMSGVAYLAALVVYQVLRAFSMQ